MNESINTTISNVLKKITNVVKDMENVILANIIYLAKNVMINVINNTMHKTPFHKNEVASEIFDDAIHRGDKEYDEEHSGSSSECSDRGSR